MTRIEKTPGGKFALKSKRTGETHSTHGTREEANVKAHEMHKDRLESISSADFTHEPHKQGIAQVMPNPKASDAKHQNFE